MGAVAQTATIYTVHIDLNDLDRGVFEALDLRVARHPSESGEYLVMRLIAYCLEFEQGIAFTEGVSAGDEPAVVVRDLTGRVTAWIEVGLPDPSRLHRAGKAADRVAVYTHRDVRQFVSQLARERIHRAEALVIRSAPREAVERIAATLDRRVSMAVSVAGGELHLAIGDQTFVVPIEEHRL
jgi:uncharacterized protein YaeQ